MTCDQCHKRPPIPSWLADLEAVRQDAPRSRFPLLSYAWAPYDDDPDHGTMLLEIAYGGAEEGAPGDEFLLGGVHAGGFDWRALMAAAPRVRLADAIADGDTTDHRPQAVSARSEARGGVWRAR